MTSLALACKLNATQSLPSKVARMVAALRCIGGSLWMVDNAYTGAFVDNVGAVPVTAYGDLLGRSLDKTGSNHATQSAVASKPSVQRVPRRTRGAVNQLLWSGDFSNAAWQKVSTTLGASTADPNGGTSATIATFAYGGTVRQHSIAWTAGTVGTIAVWVRKSTSGGANAIRLTTNNTAAWNTGITQKFTLTAEWQLVVMSGVLTSTGTTLSVIVGGIDAGESGDADCTGNVDIYRAGLFQGTVTAQQIIDNGGIPLTTTTALPNVLEWATVISFDGSNDFLQTGITTGEQGFVAAAVTPANTTASMSVVNAGEGASTIPGVWLFCAGGAWYASSANGTGRDQASRAMPGAVPHVVSMRWGAASISMGVDGTETSEARTGNCASGANVLRIGMYQGSLMPFNGPMHAVVYSAVDPDAATRKVIINGLAALQGRTL